jgi:hypothetical protein
MDKLAGLYRQRGKYAQAEQLYINALSVGQGVLSKTNPVLCKKSINE